MKHALFHRTVRSPRNRIASGLLAVGAIAAGCVVSSAPASAQVAYLVPPGAAYEAAPPPRVGYVWQPGYWGWAHGRYVWVQGSWIAATGPAPVAQPPVPVSNVMRLSTDALFPFDRGDVSDILPGGRADIREIAARLRATHFRRIEVRGYTDRLGSSDYNLQLSQRRANAVKALLIQQGLPADRIDARGLGEQDPITQCADGQSHASLVSCLQPDRRVEIVTFARTPGRPMPPERAMYNAQ